MGEQTSKGKVIFPLNVGISEAIIADGTTYDYDNHTDHETKAYTNVSINPVFVQNNVKYENNVEYNTTGYDVIKNSANFMEIRNTARATSISNDGTDRIGNRILPTDETLSTYGNCNEETPSHKIKVMDAEIATSNSVTNRKFIYSTSNYPNSDEVGLDVENYDYFILINPEIVEAGSDKVRPHFAKITRIVSFDTFGDGLEFTPSYPTAIPKNTKFEVYKGPAKTDTSVVAVSYGLRGDTSATTPKYDRVNICSLPTWYFYNDRLDEKNQLDYMTKYTATHLRWWENTTTVVTDMVVSGSDTQLLQWEAGSTDKYYQLSQTNWEKLVEGQSIWLNTNGTLLGNIESKYTDGSDYRFYLDYARQTITQVGPGSITIKVGKTAHNVVFRTEAKFDNTITNLGKDKLHATLIDTNRSDDYNITDAHKWNTIFPKMHRHTANLITDATNSMDGNLTGPSKYITFEKADFKNNKLPLIQGAQLNSPRNKMSQLASFKTLDSSGLAHLKIKEDDDLLVQNHVYTTTMKYYPVEGKVSSITTVEDTTLTFHGSFSSGGTNIFVVVGDARSFFNTGDKIYNHSGALLGVISTLEAPNVPNSGQSRITLNATTAAAITGSETVMRMPHDKVEIKDISKEFDLRHKLSTNDIIEIENYLYVVDTVYAQSGGTQKIKIKDSKLKSATTWSGSSSVQSISQKTLYVSPYTGVLNYDLVTDTEIDYTTNRITIDGVTIEKPRTKLNEARLVFGNHSSHDNKLDITDKNNLFAKIQDTDRTFYQRSNESKGRFYYYTGGYAISETAFNGTIESVTSETNSGMTTYAINGRDETSKLISQTINKNTAILSDIHHSSIDPILDNVTDLSVGVISVNGSVLTYGGTTSNIVLKPFGILLNADGKFVGEIKSYTTSPKEITFIRPPQITSFNSSGVNLKYYNPYAYLDTDTTHTTYITGTKALGSNPNITNTQSDLSVSGKGLVFDGGQRMIPPATAETYYTNATFTTENLVGTSNTGGILKDKTLGYELASPKNIDTNDSNFAIKIGNENGISFTDNSVGTVKQETFDVVSVNEKIEGNTTISIAPNFPVVMGRIASNTSDTRGNCSMYFVNGNLNTGGFIHRLGVGNSYTDHIDGECIRYWDFQGMKPGTISRNYDSIYNTGVSPQKIQGYAVGYGVRANGSKISVTNSNTNRPINGSNTLDGWTHLGAFYSPSKLIQSYYPGALTTGDPYEYDIAWDAFEQIDPRTDYYDWFGIGDLYPASNNRNNNLGYHTLNYEDFSMLLESDSEETGTTTLHEEYIGTTTQTVKQENNFESVSISSATQTTNEISRFGVIRLVEATFDWHFNPIDLETNLPSGNIPTIPYFDYVMFENPDDAGGTIQLRETDGANVNVSNTNITSQTLGDMFYTTDYMGSNPMANHSAISGSPDQINGFIAVKESGSSGSFNTDSGNNNLIDATTLDGNGYTETYNDIWQFDGYDDGGTIKYYGVQPFYVHSNTSNLLDLANNPTGTDHIGYTRNNRHNDFRFTNVYITRPVTKTTNYGFAKLEDEGDNFSAHNIILPLITQELSNDSTWENKEISPFHHPDNWAGQNTNWHHMSRVINALVGAKFGADSGTTISHHDKYGLGYGTYPFAHPYEGCIGVFKDIEVAMTGNTVDPGNIEITSSPLALDTNANYLAYVASATNANLDQHDRNVMVKVPFSDANTTVAMIGTRTERDFLVNKEAIPDDDHENHHGEFSSSDNNTGLVVSAQMAIKPVFELKSTASSGNYTVGGTDASLSFPNGTTNSIGDTMVFILNNASKHTFLSFLPNLTGYYLVSEEKGSGGDLRNTKRRDSPRAITRITSHTVSTTPTNSNHETHTIKIDVPLKTQYSTNHRFRLMRPSEVTFNGETDYIRFNVMEPISKFRRSSFLNGGLGDVEGTDTIIHHYRESVYQMFLLLDVDGVPVAENTLNSAGYVTDSNRNDYDNSTIDIREPAQAAYKFKRTGTTLVQKTMNVTDGQTSSVKNLTFTDFVPIGKDITVAFDKTQTFTKKAGLTMKFDGELYGNGIVSFGEIFDVSLSRRPNLKNIKKCHIGTGFTVASTVSDEVENLVKEVDLEYDDLRSFIIPTSNIVSSTSANTVVCSATPENIATGDVLYSHEGHLIGEIQGISSQTITFTSNLKFTPAQHDEIIKINKKTYVSSLKFDDVNLFTAINALAVKNGLDYNIRNGKFTARNIEDTSSLRKYALSYKESDRLISVENNTSLFDSANKAVIIGDRVKYELEKPTKGQTRVIQEIDPAIKTKTDAEIRAVELLSLHNSDNRKITIKVHKQGLELLEAGDIVRLNFPNHNIPIGDYIVFEITNVLAGVLTMVVGTFDKTIAERLSELNTKQSDGFSSLFKKDALQVSAGKFLFDTINIKDISVSYEITGSSNELSYNSNMGFDDLVGFTEEVGFEHSVVTKKSYGNKFYEQEDYGGLSE